MPSGDSTKIDLKSNDITDDITKDEINKVSISEENIINTPNYIIDLTNIKEVEPIQIQALDSILFKDGDISIYVYSNGVVQKIGNSRSNIANRILFQAMVNIFGDKCKIYKDFKVGNIAKPLNNKSISYLRLNL